MKAVEKALCAVVCVLLILGGSAVFAEDGDTKPLDAETYYQKAKELSDKGQYEEAEKNLLLALKAGPNHQKAKELLVTVKQELAKKTEYDTLLEKVRADERARREYSMRLADHYYNAALKRFDERRYLEAEQNLLSALEANPKHKKAKDKLVIVRRLLRKDPSGEPNIIDLERTRRMVQLQLARRELRKAILDAKQLINAKSYDAALGKLDAARDSGKVLAARIDVSRELAEIKTLYDTAQAARDRATKEEEEKKLEKARAIADSDRVRLLSLYQQRITRLFEDAKRLFDQTRYLLAAAKADEILKIDPRNKEVIAFRDKCYEARVAQELAWYDQTKKRETDEAWRIVRSLSIPFTQVMPVYPDDWDEKRKRTAGVEIEAESPEDAKWKKDLNVILEQPISFDFIATPLDDVVAFLRNLKQVNIVVDKKSVAELGGGLDVTLRLEKVKFKDALEWVLRLINLKYTLQNGVIFISTKEKIGATTQTVTRFYDVTDLTIEIRNFTPNVKAISNANLDDIEEMDDIFNEEPAEDEERADTFTGESLVEFIKSVIAPGTWEDIGGAGPL